MTEQLRQMSQHECREYVDLYTHYAGRAERAEAEIERLRGLLCRGAELMDVAASDIDSMFPNDENPEMQSDLRTIALRFRVLAGAPTDE